VLVTYQQLARPLYKLCNYTAYIHELIDEEVRALIVCTGQHHDYVMLSVFFSE